MMQKFGATNKLWSYRPQLVVCPLSMTTISSGFYNGMVLAINQSDDCPLSENSGNTVKLIDNMEINTNRNCVFCDSRKKLQIYRIDQSGPFTTSNIMYMCSTHTKKFKTQIKRNPTYTVKNLIDSCKYMSTHNNW